jgi:hypothetical protein
VRLSDLLVDLKNNVDGLSKLPSDARTQLKTNIVFEKSVIEPGSYIHFGLEMQLKCLISNIPSANNIPDLKRLLNINGLPLFKSSAGKVYPILGFRQLRRIWDTTCIVYIYCAGIKKVYIYCADIKKVY